MKSNTKKAKAYRCLKERILKGELPPGEKLVLRKLAVEYECSEIPVREALAQLSAEGYVSLNPHSGAVVASMSPAEVSNLFDIRVALESLATELAVHNIEKSDIAEIESIVSLSKSAFNQKSYRLFKDLNYKFHMYIYQKSHNDTLVKMIDDLWENASRYRSAFENNDAHIAESILEHDAIMQAISLGESHLAGALMKMHKKRAKRNTVAANLEKNINW